MWRGIMGVLGCGAAVLYVQRLGAKVLEYPCYDLGQECKGEVYEWDLGLEKNSSWEKLMGTKTLVIRDSWCAGWLEINKCLIRRR